MEAKRKAHADAHALLGPAAGTQVLVDAEVLIVAWSERSECHGCLRQLSAPRWRLGVGLLPQACRRNPSLP
jgi:hypothetical protein